MVNSKAPCTDCLHKPVCMHQKEAAEAYLSLSQNSYRLPRNNKFSELPTDTISYASAKLFTFDVKCSKALYRGSVGVSDVYPEG